MKLFSDRPWFSTGLQTAAQLSILVGVLMSALSQLRMRVKREVTIAPSPHPSPPPAKKAQAFLTGGGEGAKEANPKVKL